MALLHHAPRLDVAAAETLARELYGLAGIASPLPSERDQNFLMTVSGGRRFVLKIANATEDYALLDAQNGAMAHVASRAPICPAVVPTRTGELIAQHRD